MTQPDLLHLPRQEQWAILEAATARPRTYFLREGIDALTAAEGALVARWAQQRCQGVPLAYLLGFREFYGHRFWVNPAVLIPRADTELLAELALSVCAPNSRILELGTGSGCVVITILKEATAKGLPIQAWATDRSPEALATAKNNACWHGVHVRWAIGDWFAALSSRRTPEPAHDPAPEPCTKGLRFDVIVSNPPYIADKDPHLTEGDLRYEPRAALTGARTRDDGLGEMAQIISQAPDWLVSAGSLVLEHGWDQQSAVIELCKMAGFSEAIGMRDLAGIPRAVHARL